MQDTRKKKQNKKVAREGPRRAATDRKSEPLSFPRATTLAPLQVQAPHRFTRVVPWATARESEMSRQRHRSALKKLSWPCMSSWSPTSALKTRNLLPSLIPLTHPAHRPPAAGKLLRSIFFYFFQPGK